MRDSIDELYAQLRLTDRRQKLLASAPDHRLVIERRAQLALEAGNPGETLRLLRSIHWPREHQRYIRSQLWKEACSALGRPETELPEFLNEDNLAQFGAYWSET